MNKSLDTLLKASVALISLILLAGVFVGNIVKWRHEVNDCRNNAGECLPNDTDDSGNYLHCPSNKLIEHPCYKPPFYKELDTEKICCMVK